MSFRFTMISAMYENGGNTTQRFLDSHPELFVYPFESQVGTTYVHDHLTSAFPVKYRWPTFPLQQTGEQDYRSIIDEECKVRLRTPHVSKFRDVDLLLNDEERGYIFLSLVQKRDRTRGAIVASFFEATFAAWKNFNVSGKEKMYVGYSPIIGVDADKIINDFPDSHVLHIVRNPWSAYADTKKRPVPLSLERYVTLWCLVQYHALTFRACSPDRIHIIRYEDLVRDPQGTLGNVCNKLGLLEPHSFSGPTWNREPLTEVYPWGT